MLNRSRPRVYRADPFAPKRNYKANVNCNPFGCLLTIIAVILIAFVLTHIGPLWADLSRILGS